MKVVLLAGGFGTRISEESGVRPKPMVEIGGYPILWHIMKIYAHYGLNDFIVCLGYKGHVIKEYFSNYFLHHSDVTFDLEKNTMQVHQGRTEPWKITLIDTGENSMTGGRLKRIKPYLDGTFCMTYGDGVSNINISSLIDFHRKENKLATLTAVRQEGRFGIFSLKPRESSITYFKEKPQGDGDETAWINGGFFVLEPEVMDYIEGDHTVWEKDPMQNLASDGQLNAFRHSGFWKPMDTLRDKNVLEDMWQQGKAEWKIWK
jgi:glucose-1-phosphate cytidylyltransferase